MKNCALTGHRTLPPDFDKNALYDALEGLVKEGYDRFYCGMAEGFDLEALDCLVALRAKYRIILAACIPFEGQEMRFSKENRRKYRSLLPWCDETILLYPAYREGCYLARNRYMVEKADLLFAYCRKEKGGSAYTVHYARRLGVEVRLFGGNGGE